MCWHVRVVAGAANEMIKSRVNGANVSAVQSKRTVPHLSLMPGCGVLLYALRSTHPPLASHGRI